MLRNASLIEYWVTTVGGDIRVCVDTKFTTADPEGLRRAVLVHLGKQRLLTAFILAGKMLIKRDDRIVMYLAYSKVDGWRAQPIETLDKARV